MPNTATIRITLDDDLVSIARAAGDLADVARRALDEAREDGLNRPAAVRAMGGLLILGDDVERLEVALEALAATVDDVVGDDRLYGERITPEQVDERALRLEGNAVGLSDLSSGDRAHYRRVAREQLVAERRDAGAAR